MAQIRDGKYAPLRIKLLWTVVFFVCFIGGRKIPVPFLHDVPKGSSAASADLLNAANNASGGNFFHPSLFSLGLGPWMGAVILWRFLFIGKLARDRKIPEDTVNRARNVLMVALALFQANSMMGRYVVGSLTWGPFSNRVNAEIVIVVFLTVGALLVAWLAKKNEDFGLGGITMFILYQIIITATQNTHVFSVATSNSHNLHIFWLVMVACVCVAILGVIAGRAELRLHVNKVSIDSGYTGMSYLPIKLNPAGASPIMYALTLLALPQYVAHAVSAVAPSTSGGVNRFVSHWGLNSTAGFTVYLVLLSSLTIFFGLLTVGPKDVAERMQKGGEYFDHIPPGPATRQYVRRRVIRLSVRSGLLLVIFTGLPLYFIGSHANLQYLLTTPGTLMIVIGLLWLLEEDIADTLLGTRYVFAFKANTGKVPAGRTAA